MNKTSIEQTIILYIIQIKAKQSIVSINFYRGILHYICNDW